MFGDYDCMETPFDLDFIIRSFNLNGKFIGFKLKNDGHINSTYLIEFENANGERNKYTLQKINTYVFKDANKLMSNIVGITSHIENKLSDNASNSEMKVLSFLSTTDGKYFTVDKNGDCWRCYNYIDNVYTCNTIDSPDVFYNAGKSFGNFQNLLSDYPIDSLFETIPKFHDTFSRFNDFLASVEKDAVNRAENVKDEINFVLEREADTKILLALLEKGELPLRVTHNDTKLNNILFDENTDEGICIIDLDTVMPGLSLYDFGDSIRFGANTASEDEKDLDKVSLDLELYKAYTEGYLASAKNSLTEKEIFYLPFSAKLMTFECGMRFLADYLDGDVYFKTDYPEHNLVRARNQFKLVADIESKYAQMQKITADAVLGE